MKKFFTRNRKLIEILLSLGFVFLIGAYYYLIYIPGRENEIIARRFRTVQRIERNMNDKFQVYMQAMNDCISTADKPNFKEIVKGYNSDSTKFYIKFSEAIENGSSYRSLDSLKKSLVDDSMAISQNIGSRRGGKRLIINLDRYQLLKNGLIKHISAEGDIDYSSFVQPLLKKNVFDHYIVFYIDSNASNTVYEDFQSGISFKGLDSLFDTKAKIYTSKIINIKTAGESYLAFIQPYGYKSKNDRIIAGLLNQENFDKESRQLPESMVTTLLFIALFTLLLFPLIRLAIMGKKDRILYVHLFAAYLSFLLLIPVAILFFISNNKGFLKTDNAKDHSKKILADQISQSFNYEINSAYNLLNKFDSLYSRDSTLDTVNIKYLGDNAVVPNVYSTNNKESINVALDSLKAYLKINPVRYQNAKRLLWLDSLGMTIAIWAFDTDPPRANYKERKYFQDVQSNNLISLNGDPAKNVAIEPITSRTDGNFKVAVSKASIDTNKQLVAVVISRFSSVTNPVLPGGFEFSIIDQEGNTIFDSDTTENLNENLLNEFTDSMPLKTALNTKTLAEFKTRHEDKDYDVLVEPINWLPYYVVILEDSAFNSSLYTQSLSFTVVMMFSLFVFLCLEMLIIILAHYHSSKLQNNSFDFSWIHPRTHLSYKYFVLFLFNTSALIVLALFCFIHFSMERFTGYLFLFVIAILLSRIFFFILKVKNKKDEHSVTGQKRIRSNKLSVRLLTGLAIIALINSFFFQVLTITLLFSSILTGLAFLFFRLWEKKPLPFPQNYMVNFRLMIFSRLLLISGLPVIIFFNSIYNFEQRLEQRANLLD
ncbi:MAG TPA: cache domain-containing protein, partial [Hanamia sp.]